MQSEGQPADGTVSGAAPSARIDAALDAAFAAVEAALAQAGSLDDRDCVSAASAGAVAELLVRGLASSDASVARRAALSISRLVPDDREGTAASAVVAVSHGAALPALARMAASGYDDAADAAWAAVRVLLMGHGEGVARRDVMYRFTAIQYAKECLIEAVMERETCSAALGVIHALILHGGAALSAQFAAADGFCGRLVSFAVAAGDSPSQPSDDRFPSCCAALACMDALLLRQPEAAAPALMAAEGLCPALEGLVARAASNMVGGEVNAVHAAIRTIQALAEQSVAAPRRAAGLDGLLAGLAAALAEPFFRQDAGDALRAIATRGGGAGKAAVAAAVAGALARAADDDAKQELRDWLAAPPMQMESGAIGALELQAAEAAALRARVAELEAIPVNTRAAIVELAHAVRGARLEEGEEAAAGEE
ncbi:hypothetical protein Rsub_00657 [Raphidocelis subcapitata]|uniref:Uncharacterized protein n=1 Tax=Raphidocelis subcapitata TaxID=307507 RepID=A0A2V0NSY2_9CHLO|nr:hypothetical protein Rsub_00657 [Raphidocelis subcapitata]|eukprot:GBF87945.1 hypothetical protein Rsub_00657 [Raphidocelis subcapitata]